MRTNSASLVPGLSPRQTDKGKGPYSGGPFLTFPKGGSPPPLLDAGATSSASATPTDRSLPGSHRLYVTVTLKPTASSLDGDACEVAVRRQDFTAPTVAVLLTETFAERNAWALGESAPVV
jgi:hypothetical protein